jgi:hypothetical protein
MPNDISQPREGENRRSHQARRDASSSNGGRVRDFATLPFQRYEEQRRATEQQTNGKGLAPAERKNRRAIDENGQLVERTVNLRNRYDMDHPGLPGGMNRGYRYWIEGGENDPEHEAPSGRDLNQGLAIHMDQQRATQRQEPDASSSRQGEIPAERKNDIEKLIEDLIAFPGSRYRNNEIRKKMRANKIEDGECTYVRRSIYNREYIDNQRKKGIMSCIYEAYCNRVLK